MLGADGSFQPGAISGVVIDSNCHFTCCQSNSFNGTTVISGLLAGAECGISAAIAPWCLTACSLTYHRRVCLIDTYTTHFCALSMYRSTSNYPFDAQNACSNKTRKTVPLKVCTLTTHIVRLRACCFTSATTMDRWSIWWSSCTTYHAHSLLYIHLELQLTLES